jgi:nucleoside-diphosphate-sugar epimerase
MVSKICIVAGALGVAGRALIELLQSQPDWHVIALSRRTPNFPSRAQFVSVDLEDADKCVRTLGALPELTGVTHVFFAAYAPRDLLTDEVKPNLAMLSNLVTVVEGAAPRLRHVCLVQGSKWYGNHLGAYKTPANEDDTRHMPPNFYYDQQDWLEQRQQGKSWSWTALRPHGLLGVSLGSPMNQLMALAVYASISRELGLPLRFPGSPGAFRAVYQFTDATLLARAMLWAAGTPACANQAFNMTNGEFERWENIWPPLAENFAIKPGPVQSISLARFMADKEPIWTRIRARHGLRAHPLSALVNWQFADWVYANDFDQMSNLGKARRAGWTESLDTMTMFRSLFDKLRAERIIP